jgi:phosphoglycerate kinase
MKNFEEHNFSDKKVLIRVDFNVPLDQDFKVTDDTRIRKAIPTILKVLNDGGSVILMSHLGRPKGAFDKKFSMKHLLPAISSLLSSDVQFSSDCIGEEAESLSANLKPGEVLLLENLRFHKHETAGTEDFAKNLSKLGDFYVNDAFGTAHRAHASTTTVARFFPDNKCFGLLMQNEIAHIDKFLREGQRPLTAIMGGAKVSSKIPIIENLLDKVDHLIVGGGMIYSFIKASGGNTGSSLVEDDKLDLAQGILSAAKEKGVSIHLPIDSIVADKFDNDANIKIVPSENIPDGWMGLDIGPEAIAQFSEVIGLSKTILWNGPMGVFEMENFSNGTKMIAEAIRNATKEGCYSLIGGGDSVAAINKFNMANDVSYVSTGGGALMEYLEGKILPGIQAIKE